MIEILESTYQVLVLLGGIFLVTGLITYNYPPKKINVLYGYRTSSSMKNQERWDFAQRVSSVRMMQIGIGILIISFLKSVINTRNLEYDIVVSLLTLFSSVLILFFTTEKAIRNKFN